MDIDELDKKWIDKRKQHKGTIKEFYYNNAKELFKDFSIVMEEEVDIDSFSSIGKKMIFGLLIAGDPFYAG